MYFWVLAAVLTVVAILVVTVPLLRTPKRSPGAFEFDKELYKDRLVEIDRDLALGRISAEEAETARAEEGRKLIALSKADQSDTPAKAGLSGRPVATIAAGIVAIPLAAFGLYSMLGTPTAPDLPLSARKSGDPSGQSITELVARAEGYLAKNPDDAKGWAVLAPVYTRLGRFEDAANAWQNVYRIDPEYPEIRATLGESLMGISNGIVTERAHELFAAELEKNPSSFKARYYMAMALAQEGNNEEAAQAWQALIETSPPDAGWLESAYAFRNQAREAAGLPALEDAPQTAGASPGPTQEQVAAASEMTAEERQQMISGMVARLEEKLAENPSDKQGWQRLVRAYIVMGRKDDAAKAIETALASNPGDSAFAEEMEAARSELGN
jgi:cytochrome c-type biogenesis protein CcmH